MVKGKIWKFGNNINTDVIYPGRWLKITGDPKEMASHSFEGVMPDFVKKIQKGDIIVAGRYFGCGSSREQAVTCLKHLGIGGIIAESFARIYYRNAINLGVPILIAPGISKKIEQGNFDFIEVDFAKGLIKLKDTEIKVAPLPEFILEIIKEGGLIPHIKKNLVNL